MHYMPPLTNPSLNIWKSIEEIEEQKQSLANRKEEVLRYLAGELSNGNLEPEPARTTIPELGNHPCCDTTIFEIFFRVICNPWRLTKDTLCGCFIPCSMPEPKKNTYVPKDVYNRLRSADIYLNRNTCLLCCVTPPLLITCAFSPYVTGPNPLILKGINSGASGSASCCSIVSAGWLTYFWSGDFGGREQKSYEEMKAIFEDLAEYLHYEWERADLGKSAMLIELCERIRCNSQNIIKGMQNGGISSLHVAEITKKLFYQIYLILKNTNFQKVGFAPFELQME